MWRVLDAILDPQRRGTGFKGLVIPIGYLIRGLVYGGVGLEAFRLARGLRASHGTDTTVRLWTAKVMALPLGEWLVGIAGAITAADGVSEIIDAIRDADEGHKDLSALDPAAAGCSTGSAGSASLPRADHRRARRAAGARGDVARSSHGHGRPRIDPEPGRAGPGTWLLGFTAIGLIAYAVDQALHARYGHIRSPLDRHAVRSADDPSLLRRPGHGLLASQETLDVVPVGVCYDLDPDPARRRTDLENMRRLRFTVIAPGPSAPGRHGPSRASTFVARRLTGLDRDHAGIGDRHGADRRAHRHRLRA